VNPPREWLWGQTKNKEIRLKNNCNQRGGEGEEEKDIGRDPQDGGDVEIGGMKYD